MTPLLTIVRSLEFQQDRRALLRDIPESAWAKLLPSTDDAKLTLPLAIRCSEYLTAAVRTRVLENLASNARRHERVVRDWGEIAAALTANGVEFIGLKGLTQWPYYSDDPLHRAQYDFDIYCPPDSILAARDAIAALGYEPIRAAAEPGTDHLPAMIRNAGYRWRKDYFDPALPLSVELHFRFWNPEQESFEVRSAARFWDRRTVRTVGDLGVPALHPVDSLSYATWHVVRHLLRGNLRLHHVYEIAHFLERSQGDDAFWSEWADANSAGPAVAEGIAFRLASEWFGCGIHGAALEQIRGLPQDVSRWFGLFAFSPVLALERINKDELFLHLSLASRRRDKLRIVARRIFPRVPPEADLEAQAPVPSSGTSLRRITLRTRFILDGMLRHARALWPVVRGTVRWYR